MPAGAGPAVGAAAAVVLPANTTENVLCTIPPSSWNNPNGLGNLLTFSLILTGAAAGTITFRVRQGNSNAGAQVGTSLPVTAANAAVAAAGLAFADASAFANAQQGGQYVLTYQQSAVSLGTINNAVLELETVSAVS